MVVFVRFLAGIFLTPEGCVVSRQKHVRWSLICKERIAWIFLIVSGFFGAGCEHIFKNKMEDEFVATRIEIIKSKIDGGDLMAAQSDLIPLKKKFPDNPDLITLSGFVDITLGNNERAIKSMHQAYRLDPSPSSLLNLSSAYIADKRYHVALKVIQDGLIMSEQQGNTEIGRLFHNRGYVYEMTHRVELAIKSYKEALYHIPGYLQTLHRLTMLYDSLGRQNESIPYYQRYTYFCRGCFEPVEKLVLYYLKSGDRQVATQVMSHYLNNPELSQKNKQKAQRLHRHILESSPSQYVKPAP